MTEKEQPEFDEAALQAHMDRLRKATQHDELWWALGWLPTILKNWKALGIAIFIAIFIGGQKLIDNIATILGGYLP